MTEDRSRAIEEFARSEGLTYSEVVPDGVVDARFYLFSLDTGGVIGVATDMIEGDWKGAPVRAFDFTLPEKEAMATDVGWSRLADVSVAMVEVDADLPYAYVEKTDFLSRVADELQRITHLHTDHLEVDGGVREFDREFEVLSPDAAFARELFGDHALAWAMVATGVGFAYEIRGDRAIVYGDGLEVTEWPRLLDAAASFREHLPPALLARYPKG